MHVPTHIISWDKFPLIQGPAENHDSHVSLLTKLPVDGRLEDLLQLMTALTAYTVVVNVLGIHLLNYHIHYIFNLIATLTTFFAGKQYEWKQNIIFTLQAYS
jgi:hypothetical protein